MKPILIVDDKTENLYLLQALLQGNSYEVLTAENGAEALALAKKSPPSLVIADILMPVMDGFSMCREWKRDPVLRPIPFVFYTATYTDAKDEQFALSLGADLFFTKPAEPDVLLKAIRKLLDETEASGMARAGSTEQPDVTFLQKYNAVLIRKLEDKLEELEKANAELRALDIMKNNLLMNVSHELRTPLTVVRGYTELIGNGSSGPITEKQATQCAVMHNNLDRLLHMINNLLYMADPESCDKDRKVVNIALEELFIVLKDITHIKAAEKSLGMVFQETAAIVRGDRHEVMQALFNLLDNAVKFTSKGGNVSVSTETTGGYVRIRFSDTGIGVPAEEQQRIFEQFYQVDTSTTRRYGGLGLGLSIVREIAQRNGGRIELSSGPGKGSVFTLILPAAT